MQGRIENPGSPEDYVDGLRHKKPANFNTEPDTVTFSVTGSGNPTRRQRGVDTRISGPVRCMVGAALFVAGAATGAVLVASASPATTETARAPTTVSEPESTPSSRPPEPTKPAPAPPPGLSPECQRALDGMVYYLDSAIAISRVNDKQLDILSESYQAIFRKDWKKLNELAGRQRELDRSLATDKAKVLPKSLELREDLAKCRSQQN